MDDIGKQNKKKLNECIKIKKKRGQEICTKTKN